MPLLRLTRPVAVLIIAVIAHAMMLNVSSATTILDFSKLQSAGVTPVSIVHDGTTHATSIASSAPIAVNINNAPAAAMDGTAYLFFVNVQSSSVPNSKFSIQTGFTGDIYFSKSSSNYLGSNLVLRAHFTNAQLGLHGPVGTFSVANSGSQTLSMTSAYVNISGQQSFTVSFSTISPPTVFKNPDTSFSIVLDPAGNAAASTVVFVVPEPSTLIGAAFASCGLVATVRRQRRSVIATE